MQAVREIMNSQGIIAADLARQTGIAPPRISRWLNGEGNPTFEQYCRIARALGVTLDAIAGHEKPSAISQEELIILGLVRDLGIQESRRRLLGISPGVSSPGVSSPEDQSGIIDWKHRQESPANPSNRKEQTG